MIHPQDTLAADGTVMSSWRLDFFTLVAVSVVHELVRAEKTPVLFILLFVYSHS
jgi:hypothetical protein